MTGTLSFVLAGLLAYAGYAHAQGMNMASMMALMGAGGGGGGGAGMAGMGPMAAMMGLGGGMPEMSMTDLMLAQSLGGGSGGSGAAGAGAGADPMSAMLMAGGGGLGGSSEMSLPLMMSMMGGMGGAMGGATGGAMNGRQGRGQGGRRGNSATSSFTSSIARMLGDSGSGITPATQANLWAMVSTQGHSQRIMDAITSVNDRVKLARDGLPGLNPMMQAMSCPMPRNCMPAFCENPEKSFTPESFYACPGCPNCMGGAGRLMSMFQGGRRGLGGAGLPGLMATPSAGGSGGGMDSMARNFMIMQAMQRGGSQMSPAMIAALMAPTPAPQPQPQPQLPPMMPQMPPQMPAGMMRRPQWTPPPGFPVRPQGGPPSFGPPGFGPAPLTPGQTPPAPSPSSPTKPVTAPVSSTENKPQPGQVGTPSAAVSIPPSGGNGRPPPQFLEAMRRLGQSMSQPRPTPTA